MIYNLSHIYACLGKKILKLFSIRVSTGSSFHFSMTQRWFSLTFFLVPTHSVLPGKKEPLNVKRATECPMQSIFRAKKEPLNFLFTTKLIISGMWLTRGQISVQTTNFRKYSGFQCKNQKKLLLWGVLISVYTEISVRITCLLFLKN